MAILVVHMEEIATSIDEFIRCFHQFVSRTKITNFALFEQLKKKTNFLLVQNSFFSQFASRKRNHNKFSLKKFVDSKFEIGENI
jgi:hypothetical protein